MGCSASRPETLISSSSARKALNPLPRTISHLVHHPPLKKGDTHHLVSLTSSTYGSLLLIDHPNDPKDPSSSSSSPKDSHSPDSVINTWELMAGLGDEEIHTPKAEKTLVFDDNQCLSVKKPQFQEIQSGLVRERVRNLGSSFRSFKSSSLSDFEEDPIQDFSKTNTKPSQIDEDFRFDLVHEKKKHLGDSFFDSRKTNVFCNYEEVQTQDFAKPSPSKSASPPLQCLSFDSAIKCHLDSIKSSESIIEKAKNLGDSMKSMKTIKTMGFSDYEEVPVENSTKPLWQHLSEELILAEMDQNVISSFRKAESRKLGFSEYTKTASKSPKSPVLDTKVLPSIHIDHKIHLPGTEDRIVIYFTSLRGIRRTYEDCCIVRTIFTGLRVPVDERDISMDSSYRKELQTALDKVTISLPQVFVRGRHLGGVEEVKQLHEDGELAKVVEGFPVQDPGFVCENCGGARFVPCLNCNGSRKVFVEDEGVLRRCSHCNENGLIRCSNCCS